MVAIACSSSFGRLPRERTAPMLQVRAGAQADAEPVTALMNLDYSEPITVEQMRERLRPPASNRDVGRLVAELDDQLVGYAHAVRDDWMERGLYWVHTVVAPAVRRKGVGSALYTALLDWARPHGATTLITEARDDLPASVRFAERQGFQIERHIFESTLDLSAFDERPFVGAHDTTRVAGIRCFTMADVGDTLAARRSLYEVERTTARDIPGGSESAVRPFEAFVQQVCEAPGHHADCQFIAAEGETWVGLALLEDTATTGAMYNGITGVLPAWRGRGLAQTLKLLAIRQARQRGARYLRTHNDSQNGPMLAINRKLGYQPQPGYYRLRAPLAPLGG